MIYSNNFYSKKDYGVISYIHTILLLLRVSYIHTTCHAQFIKLCSCG